MGAANRSLLGIVDLRGARLSVDVTDRTEAEPARILRKQLKNIRFSGSDMRRDDRSCNPVFDRRGLC